MPLSPEAQHAAELIRTASEAGAKQANERLEEALDDLNRAAQILETLCRHLADWQGSYPHACEADEVIVRHDGERFVEHVRSWWNR